MFFFSSNNVERIDFGEHGIEENEAESTRNKTTSNLFKIVASNKDEIQPIDLISNKTVNFAVCHNPKQAVGSEENRRFGIREVLKENLIKNLTDHEKYVIHDNYFGLKSSC